MHPAAGEIATGGSAGDAPGGSGTSASGSAGSAPAGGSTSVGAVVGPEGGEKLRTAGARLS